ncbi:MAG: hypothetical protein KGZ34_06620 [Nitrosarchaeum sp.]|nr:hypothetical protein [Nitrosarchaeum sp.]
MNNEIGRKITSLTLMTIMLAGGLTFAAPSMMPVAHAANANLFVSAENSQFNNYMSGPQVIEVVVIDSNISDTDEGKGEPDVRVNGKKLRMVQAVDGNWYGYFADRDMALIADSTSPLAGEGLDFGEFCDRDFSFDIDGATVLNPTVTFTDTVGIAFPDNDDVDGIQGANPAVPIASGECTDLTTAATAGGNNANVVRESKSINGGSATVAAGQIGADDALWPFIQLYTLNPTGNVVVTYNKGGGAQTTTLTFDTVDQFANVSLDRSVYPQGAQVHATITDAWLNIDPTDEDSWTFGTFGTVSTNYQVFNENGEPVATVESATLTNTLSDLMCDGNCILEVNPDQQNKGNVITLQDNDDSDITATTGGLDEDDPEDWETSAGLVSGFIPITITEQGPKSGIFGTYDESDDSNIVIRATALRGTSATIDYNEAPRTILVGHSFGTIDIQSPTGEWNSGEETPVTLVDGDANKNSRADEDLDLNNPAVSLIPSLRTGDPFTIGEVTPTPLVLFGVTGAIGAGDFDAAFTPDASTAAIAVDRFSERAVVTTTGATATADTIVIDFGTTGAELFKSINDNDSNDNTVSNEDVDTFKGFNLVNIDVRSLSPTGVYNVYVLENTGAGGSIITGGALSSASIFARTVATGVSAQSITLMTGDDIFEGAGTDSITSTANNIGLAIERTSGTFVTDPKEAIAADFFSFGFNSNGGKSTERIANQIVRLELEETGDNTSTFAGSLEFVMINQLNILDPVTYTSLAPIADDPTFIVIEDLTDEDSPRVNYLDRGADGTDTQIADQQAAPSHSGVVSFDKSSYKEADTVIITLQDQDLNVDVDLIDIYTTVTSDSTTATFEILSDAVGDDAFEQELSFGVLGRLLDITFDDERWIDSEEGVDQNNDGDGLDAGESCAGAATPVGGLAATGFTLIETGPATGLFTGDFIIPNSYCSRQGASAGTIVPVMGLDIEVNYVDFRDASGEIIEVGDSAGIRANTGSVSLDRTVYPVPFGIPDDFTISATKNTPTGRSVFPIHSAGLDTTNGLGAGEFLSNGDLTIHVRVNDPDFDLSASGEDDISVNTAEKPVGPVKVSVIRGSSEVVLGYAGGDAPVEGVIDVGDAGTTAEILATGALVFVYDVDGDNVDTDADDIVETDADDVLIRQFGSLDEIAPAAGIFEIDLTLRYTDGPTNPVCPNTGAYTGIDSDGGGLVTDRFSVNPGAADYCIIQGDILQVEYTDPADASGDVNTVTDSATFDLRNGVLQSDKSVYIIGSDMILTLIEPDFDLDNDQAETYDLDIIEWDSDAATLSMGNAGGSANAFDPEPSDFRETGDSTGIFQIVIEIPQELESDRLERGEEIQLEYTDWGPSGSDFVGDEDEDVNLTIFTSNFGATVELDQKVYTWTDKVYITIVAPDHNFDSNLIDDIGNTDLDPIKVSTRGNKLTNYKLVETGTDTGIFTGEVILTGFSTHDADGDGDVGDASEVKSGTGPTDGFLPADDDDGLTVSFEFSEDETIVGSALIRWNIGEVQWLEASYPASGTGVVRVIDPDMNLNPEAVDNFNADVWSDSDAGGIDLTVTETNEATGIFEGTVFFTVTDESSGHRLRVAEGDTVTAEYSDNTLPNPYTTADELDITATSLIGTVVPPLERAPAANLRVVDAFGNSLSTVNVDQQVQITADLANGQDREQAFAYLVQIQDGNGVTVSLAWITGSLSAGQSFSPALSWIPTDAGTYTATAFVWESVDNPTALSPPVTTTIIVK